MALIDEVKNIYDESFNNRFNKWYEKEQLEKSIKNSAGKGYTGLKINILGLDNCSELRLLFTHPDFKKRLEDKLGTGFNVEYVEKRIPYKHAILNVTTYHDEKYLHVGW